MNQVFYYTYRDDLLNLMSEIERLIEIKYVKAGRIQNSIIEAYEGVSVIPDVERAIDKRAGGGHSYLMVEKNYEISVEAMKMFDGQLRFDVRQIANPDSIFFNPGGEWSNGTIIVGDFSTISRSEVSVRLMRLVQKIIRNKFTKVERYWLGPNALVALKSGWRLTHAADMSTDYDLRLK